MKLLSIPPAPLPPLLALALAPVDDVVLLDCVAASVVGWKHGSVLYVENGHLPSHAFMVAALLSIHFRKLNTHR